MSELTAKQAQFVREYLIDLNATQAAIRCGYALSGAHVQGARLLSNAKIAAAVEQAKADRSQKTNIDAAWVLERLAAEAVADISDLYDEHGELLPVHDWPLIWRQGLVQGIDVEELFDGRGDNRVQIGVVRKVRLSDRVKRLELIGKHIGVNAFQDQVKVTGLDALADRMARVRAKK